MTLSRKWSVCYLIGTVYCSTAMAGGGYFSLGDGPIARQTAGAVTAVAEDAFAGSSNPAKLTAVGDRVEIGLEFFNPHRKVKRTDAAGPGEVYNFSSTSKNSLFLIPEIAWSRQLSDRFALGVTAYANGGLNSEYEQTTGVDGTNGNPETCKDKPGNFFLGCGNAGFDLNQLVLAPTLAWKITEHQSIGVAPLIAIQRFEAFGLQALTPLSRFPEKVTNRGHDIAVGTGVRIGWYAKPLPWISIGAAYATKTSMQEFDKYEGLFAEGSFDIPENYNIGVAMRPNHQWSLSLDIQKIHYSDVKALGNSVTNSLIDPVVSPLGSASGSAFGWRRDQTNYRVGAAYRSTPRLTIRAGYAYGKRPNKESIEAVSFSMLTPNPIHQATLGFSWETTRGNALHVAIARYLRSSYRGPSALVPGATETLAAHVNTLSIGWTWVL
ncbi:long-chain fatty acid transporter [Halieaceae bacterium IMCC8485]|uniref:Long-chain fatty acid transporter n=1 Tax=Candidatus Seongchinamella marina TaxID=2518990 RepID=A0ABT3SZQ8_9GAMM|nr:outer membrane protein transport protein [Candidatus Seongchinamella marina]MCX2975492.1 long-chain fatty acid transporter [Candidatus Seongchinamella marina]